MVVFYYYDFTVGTTYYEQENNKIIFRCGFLCVIDVTIVHLLTFKTEKIIIKLEIRKFIKMHIKMIFNLTAAIMSGCNYKTKAARIRIIRLFTMRFVWSNKKFQLHILIICSTLSPTIKFIL